MKLDKIISLANKKSELRFMAMLRSLRATGCNLPVWVIPYDNNLFDLPENCIWWEIKEVTEMVKQQYAGAMKTKYQCLLTDNYQYVDSDVIFLKNPETELKDVTGFISSCCHWNNPEHTYSEVSRAIFKEKSTTWQKSVFNAGQYACDTILYTLPELKATLEIPAYKEPLIDSHDQISLNLLVFLTDVKISNVTLPPHQMESTWAGDYLNEGYEKYWLDESKKPYLIHWAGYKIAIDKPIDQQFTKFLTDEEKQILVADLANFQKSLYVSPARRVYRYLRRTFLK